MKPLHTEQQMMQKNLALCGAIDEIAIYAKEVRKLAGLSNTFTAVRRLLHAVGELLLKIDSATELKREAMTCYVDIEKASQAARDCGCCGNCEG